MSATETRPETDRVMSGKAQRHASNIAYTVGVERTKEAKTVLAIDDPCSPLVRAMF